MLNPGSTPPHMGSPVLPPRRGVTVFALLAFVVTVGLATLAPVRAIAMNAQEPSAPAGQLLGTIHPATPLIDTVSASQGFFAARGISPYIVGGHVASPSAWPYITAIVVKESDGSFALCTGERVAAQWILTAQHCMYDTVTQAQISPGTARIVLGDHDLSKPLDVVTPQKIVPYPTYNAAQSLGDVALIELPANAPVSPAIDIASVADEPTLPASVWIAGWGLTSANDRGSTPNTAQEAHTTLWTQQYCGTVWSAFFDANSELCAGGPDPTPPYVAPSACSGDSGGPLVVSNASGPWTDKLLGSTDYGSTSGCASAPTVYQRTSYYYNWIVQTTGLAATMIPRAYQFGKAPSTATVKVWLSPFGANTTVELRNAADHVVAHARLAGSSSLSWTTLRANGLATSARYPGYHVVTITHYGTTRSAALTLTTAPTPYILRIHGLRHARVPANLSRHRTVLVPTGWRYASASTTSSDSTAVFFNVSAHAERITIRTTRCKCGGSHDARSFLRGGSPFGGHPWATVRTTRGTLTTSGTPLYVTAMCVLTHRGGAAFFYVDAPLSEQAAVRRILKSFLVYHS